MTLSITGTVDITHIPVLGAIPGLPTRAQAEQALRQQAQQRGVPTSRAQAEQALRQQAQQRGVILPTSIPTSTRQARRQAERELKKQAGRVGRQAVTQLGKELGVPEAQKALQDELRKMGVPPGIPVPQLPTELTAKGVSDAAYGTAKGYAEDLIRRETGLPISLPRSFSLGELERSVTGLLPADAGEAIEIGLAIGTQYAASAATSLLIGAGVGSVVPGLGTIVGIGVALGVSALKDSLKEKPPPFAKLCRTRAVCPNIPAVDAMSILVFVSKEQSLKFMPALSRERAQRYCGRGEIIECMSFLSTLGRQAFDISKKTPQVLGLYQIGRYIPEYQNAPKTGPFFDPKTKVVKTITTRAGQDITTLLVAMRKRQQKLQALVAKANQVERLPARDRASLRFQLVIELRNAAMQYQNQPNRDTEQWLKVLGAYMQRLLRSEAQSLVARQQKQQTQQRRFQQAQLDPARARAAELQKLQFKCGQGDQNACAVYRRLAATPIQRGTPASRPTPVSRPTAPVRPSGPTAAQLTQVRRTGNAMLNAFVAKNPALRRCLTPQARESILKVFIEAHAKKTIAVPTATKFIMKILNRTC